MATGGVFWVFLLFLGLKLGHVIAWSWVWVTAPVWIAAAADVLLLLITGGTIFGVYRKYRK